MHINFEFKARAGNISALEEKLRSLNPEFKGEDHQVDTYFITNNGRLKLREGNIENSLIWYERTDVAGAKQSNVILYPNQPGSNLKSILEKTLGIKVIVDKRRKIYFIGNVKFHFDQVQGLGSFVEVEAIDMTGDMSIEKLKEQCDHYAGLFELQPDNYISNSYSDMLLAANG